MDDQTPELPDLPPLAVWSVLVSVAAAAGLAAGALFVYWY